MEPISKGKEFLLNFFRLTRPLSNVKNIALLSLAFYLSGAVLDVPLLVVAAFSLSCIFSSLYAYNSLCDVGLDKTNENKKFYSSATTYFGQGWVGIIIVVLMVLGLLVGFFINIAFFSVLLALLLVGFLYSSRHTRFKEKMILDVIFGASLTFLLRFVAAWLAFSVSFPPVLAMIGLVGVKNAGYILYKNSDKPFLQKQGIKNSITVLSDRAIGWISFMFFSLALGCFIAICINPVFWHLPWLGFLPPRFLWLVVFFVPPIVVQYLLFFNVVKFQARYVRTVGFAVLFLLIIILLKIA